MIHIDGAAQIATLGGAGMKPKIGREMAELGLIEDGGIVIEDGRFVFVGGSGEARRYVEQHSGGKPVTVLSAAGKTVTPGLIDPHTHLVFAGSREFELTLRLQGAKYLDILQAGGGILSTTERTREASEEQLMAEAERRLDRFLAHGVTTVEAKSGYGLRLADELKQLRVARRLNAVHPVELVSTFMGAHAVPPEYKGNADAFVRTVIEEMIPAVARAGLAEYCDVFCEEGVFTVEQSREILMAGKRWGLKPKLHADELVSGGGAELAAELGA